VTLQPQAATGAIPEWCDAIHPRTPLWRRRAGQPVAPKPRFGGAFYIRQGLGMYFQPLDFMSI
jgi:hypothetical protein